MTLKTNCFICNKEVDKSKALYWLDPTYYPTLKEIKYLCSCSCSLNAYNTYGNHPKSISEHIINP